MTPVNCRSDFGYTLSHLKFMKEDGNVLTIWTSISLLKPIVNTPGKRNRNTDFYRLKYAKIIGCLR